MKVRQVDIIQVAAPEAGTHIEEVVRTWFSPGGNFFNVEILNGSVLRFPADRILLVTEGPLVRYRRPEQRLPARAPSV